MAGDYFFHHYDNVDPGYEKRRHFADADVELELLRSDQGDGGWSLHIVGDESEDDLVVSGPSSPKRDGGWHRPNEKDWQVAVALAKTEIRNVALG